MGCLDGRLALDDFPRLTGIALGEESVNTIGGFLVHLIGRVPKSGDVVPWERDGERLEFEILDADMRRVRRIRLRRAAPVERAGSDG